MPSKAAVPYSSGRATARRSQTLVSVELETANTFTAVRLTSTPAIARWMKRSIVALLVWAIAALGGSSMWTFVQALR